MSMDFQKIFISFFKFKVFIYGYIFEIFALIIDKKISRSTDSFFEKD